MLGIHSLVEVVIDALIESYHSKNKIYENVYCDEQLLQQLLEYLETYNYPIECFDLHFPVTKYFKYYAKKMTPDLTVLNVDTMEPLAFFKVIDDLDNLPKENFLDDAYHMNKHTKILLHIPYYIVTKNVSSGSLEFLNLIMILRKWSYNNLSENSRSIALKALYKYEILQANNRNRNYYTKIIKKDKLINLGQLAFYFLVPLSSVILLVLDALKIYPLTELRLIVFGIIILSFLIPFLAQISIKDFSVSFKEDKKAISKTDSTE